MEMSVIWETSKLFSNAREGCLIMYWKVIEMNEQKTTFLEILHLVSLIEFRQQFSVWKYVVTSISDRSLQKNTNIRFVSDLSGFAFSSCPSSGNIRGTMSRKFMASFLFLKICLTFWFPRNFVKRTKTKCFHFMIVKSRREYIWNKA